MLQEGSNLQIQSLGWTIPSNIKKWATKSAQSVTSPQYKELRQYIHRPYRKIDHQNIKCYYFPTYVIFKVKNITDFDFESLSAKINGVLIIDILVDYRDSFSPDPKNLDQASVEKALEEIFDFKFEKVRNKNKEKTNTQSEVMSKVEKPKGKQGDRKVGMKQSNQSNQSRESVKSQEKNSYDKKYLFIQFNRDNPIRLPTKRIFEGQISFSPDLEDGKVHLKWTIRKEFEISLAPGTIFEDLIAPFNLLNFKLSLIFEDIDVELPDEKQFIKLKFNCMQRIGKAAEEKNRIFEQLTFTDDGSLGEYDLAETGLQVKCEKFRSEQIKNDNADSYRSFKVITFIIPFYKYPIMDSLTIFIPLVLITILTLFTFVQGPDYNDKIGNIATLMVVYVGLVPVINDSLPPTTSITLIDLVVYCQLLINILCLIRGYTIKDYDVDQFQEYKIWKDPFFIVSVVIAIISGIVLFLLLVYYCVMKECYYNLEEADIDESERKTLHWVSPHMYNEARNIKTEIEKVEKDRSKDPKTSKDIQLQEKKPKQEQFS